MQIQINTDRHIKAHAAFTEKIKSEIESALLRMNDHLTRVEVHLSDLNGDKKGQYDKSCVIEARIKGRKPIAVTYEAGSLDKAIEGAIEKLIRLIESTLDRQQDQQRRRTDPSPQTQLSE